MINKLSDNKELMEKAIRIYHEWNVPDRVQGFVYQNWYIIRDTWKPIKDQELWCGKRSANIGTMDEHAAFEKALKDTRIRMALEEIFQLIDSGNVVSRETTTAPLTFPAM